MKFSERLKELRTKNKLSQVDIANRYSIDRTTVGKWESNSSLPSIEIINDLANFFEVSLDYMIGNSAVPYTTKDEHPYRDLEEFPEGVDVLRRGTEELSPAARKIMIKHMNQFIDDLKEIEKDEE